MGFWACETHYLPEPPAKGRNRGSSHVQPAVDVRRYPTAPVISPASRPGGRRSAAPPASGVDCPRTFLGHLRHNVEPNRPQELGMVMGEMILRRIEELLLGVTLEPRPTLAIRDPVVLSVDWGHSSDVRGQVCRGASEPERRRVRRPWPPVATVTLTFPVARWRYVSTTLPELVAVGERTRIQLCGRLSVELDGVELVQSLRGKQVPLLLAYLVLNRDRPVGREELIGALWPETAPRSQDAAMRTLLSRLRSALGRDVVSGRDELGLSLPEPAWVDVEAAASEVWRAQRALDRGTPVRPGRWRRCRSTSPAADCSRARRRLARAAPAGADGHPPAGTGGDRASGPDRRRDPAGLGRAGRAHADR